MYNAHIYLFLYKSFNITSQFQETGKEDHPTPENHLLKWLSEDQQSEDQPTSLWHKYVQMIPAKQYKIYEINRPG